MWDIELLSMTVADTSARTETPSDKSRRRKVPWRGFLGGQSLSWKH